ncbi:hypothetical protein ZIOFF_066075 [Zingiber officinale]|uniref:Piwi domain-containing protein n=1 Tax=Zingiber officinale TaxID=94328 RepID=A0A8J5EY31_ZINOF|nr:hypothetical protein ZIOFF_066075 [Zingiber officinale]
MCKIIWPGGFCHDLAQICQISGMVGGRDTVLVDALSRRIPLVSDRTTIIFGDDVTHPHPEEDSNPSIIVIVASQDWLEVTKYAGLNICHAKSRELLISFKKATRQKPQRIIFYSFPYLKFQGLLSILIICHPIEFDFYLCSHASIQVTHLTTNTFCMMYLFRLLIS